MDDDENRPPHRHQSHQGWQFTFCGGTSETSNYRGNGTQFASELIQKKLKTEGLLLLSNTQIGDRLIIVQILSGRNMVDQLRKQSLTIGLEVLVISKTASGSIVVSTKNRQVGLSAAMANKVIVKVIEKVSNYS